MGLILSVPVSVSCSIVTGVQYLEECMAEPSVSKRLWRWKHKVLFLRYIIQPSTVKSLLLC